MNHRTAALVVALAVTAGPALADVASGIDLYNRGKYADAEAALRSESGAEATAYLAGSLAKQKKYAEGEAKAKAALGEDATHKVAVAALGESLVGQKKYDDAIARMGAAIEADGGLAYAYYWRGQAFYNKKQTDRMVGDFEMFLKLAPKAPEAQTVQQVLSSIR